MAKAEIKLIKDLDKGSVKIKVDGIAKELINLLCEAMCSVDEFENVLSMSLECYRHHKANDFKDVVETYKSKEDE